MKDLGRLLTAMVTPFKNDGSVDYAKAEKLALHLLKNGSDGLVIHGTTGESPTLTHEEEFELYRVIKKAITGKGILVAGTGSNSTATSIWATKEAEKIGVDGAMLVVPYYNKPSQEGLYQHYKAVADSTGLPIIIYNIPGRSVINMAPETVARIAEIKNYAGIKEASGSLDQVSAIRMITPPGFKIWSGDDSLTLPIMAVGGCGVISVASHIAGPKIKAMLDAFLGGETVAAAELHAELMPLFRVLFMTANPTPVKAALSLVGFDVGKPRLPLIEANDKEKEAIRKVLVALKII